MIPRLLNSPFAAPLTTLAVILGVATAAACGDEPYRGPLRGNWTVSMTLDPGLPGRRLAAGTTVMGRITIPDPKPVTPRAFPEATPAEVHLDLRPFGLHVSPRRQPLVRDRGDGAVTLELGSTPQELVLVGHLEGDSVTGIWYDEFRSGGAAGRFVMRRRP